MKSVRRDNLPAFLLILFGVGLLILSALPAVSDRVPAFVQTGGAASGATIAGCGVLWWEKPWVSLSVFAGLVSCSVVVGFRLFNLLPPNAYLRLGAVVGSFILPALLVGLLFSSQRGRLEILSSQ